jgi:hypothetical protein
MRRLSREQIRFIDNYLRNSGVRYADIRFEMTDHVAAALENMDGDFYEDFRKYMVANKSELLASNRTFKKLAWKKALRVIKNNLMGISFWIVTAIVFACALGVEEYVGTETVTDNLHMVMMACSTPVFLYFWYYHMFRLNANSVIHKLLIIVYFGSIFFRLDRLIENNVTLLLFYFSFSIAFMLMLIRSLFQLNRKYKTAYNG